MLIEVLRRSTQSIKRFGRLWENWERENPLGLCQQQSWQERTVQQDQHWQIKSLGVKWMRQEGNQLVTSWFLSRADFLSWLTSCLSGALTFLTALMIMALSACWRAISTSVSAEWGPPRRASIRPLGKSWVSGIKKKHEHSLHSKWMTFVNFSTFQWQFQCCGLEIDFK